jgi:hypothetical protein
MTREECKNILVEQITSIGGIRLDELVAWSGLYIIEGFSETFHPEMLKQLMQENRISAIEYVLPKGLTLTFLMPKDTKIKLVNAR